MSNHERHHIHHHRRTPLADEVIDIHNEAAMADSGNEEPTIYVMGQNVIAFTRHVVYTRGPMFDMLRIKKNVKKS